jgi:hypothetical protein
MLLYVSNRISPLADIQKKEAIEGLKNAIEAYPEFMISEKREKEITDLCR